MLIEVDGIEKEVETRSPELGDEIAHAFEVAQILASKPGQAEAFIDHPVLTNVPVEGTLPEPHLPRFVQENGRQYVMEHVDFTRSAERGREHAGYAAYMLGGIREGSTRSSRDVEPIAVVNRIRPGTARRAESKKIEAQKYGLGALENIGVRIVRWDDPLERQQFILERVQVARSAG